MEKIRFTASNVLQNKTKFYSLTMPSDILTKCCFVSSRDEDPIMGFQRTLDEKRALEIANYIDKEQGTIPSAIILSAQEVAGVEMIGRGRTLEFMPHPKAFLILDGQHRVFGFSKSKSTLRVPVIIYVGLSRKEESRLFIDINSKQKGVPSELLLDIKRMAEYENSTEESLRSIFDLFHSDPNSALIGKLSPASKSKNKISRVTFNNSVSPVAQFFGDRDIDELYIILNSYIKAFTYGFFKENDIEEQLCNSIVFRALFSVFPEIASKVKDKFGPEYSVDNYIYVMSDMFGKISLQKIKKPGNSYKSLANHFSNSMKSNFTL
ncbi:DGQHR domain-containing protein [Halomonas sp. NyZ770]|uniref:DGQHR domain-containing protein n=1 Tax=Halomonas sp. NyZ770 TaxID=2883106 RepID=UPI001D0B3B81|nr:DGQHR domain-containing protein [Halomonas sp. NyZ770]UDM07086.1 DGQHR domain-containing protein [Halomonas sp. NyZ770]